MNKDFGREYGESRYNGNRALPVQVYLSPILYFSVMVQASYGYVFSRQLQFYRFKLRTRDTYLCVFSLSCNRLTCACPRKYKTFKDSNFSEVLEKLQFAECIYVKFSF